MVKLKLKKLKRTFKTKIETRCNWVFIEIQLFLRIMLKHNLCKQVPLMVSLICSILMTNISWTFRKKLNNRVFHLLRSLLLKTELYTKDTYSTR
jgi:hypothetical protein